VISPLLSNIYLHVLDATWRKRYTHLGVLVRYADDCAPRRCGRGLYGRRKCHAVEEMAVGPPGSGCRTRFQTP
jgi:hypothetical protein